MPHSDVDLLVISSRCGAKDDLRAWVGLQDVPSGRFARSSDLRALSAARALEPGSFVALSSRPPSDPALEDSTHPCAARVQREAEKRKGSYHEENRIMAVGGVFEPDDMLPGGYLDAYEAWRHHFRLR